MRAMGLEMVRAGIANLHRDRPELEVDVWLPAIDAHLTQPAQSVGLEKVRDLAAKWRSEVAEQKRRAQDFGIAPVKVGNEKLSCADELIAALTEKGNG